MKLPFPATDLVIQECNRSLQALQDKKMENGPHILSYMTWNGSNLFKGLR